MKLTSLSETSWASSYRWYNVVVKANIKRYPATRSRLSGKWWTVVHNGTIRWDPALVLGFYCEETLIHLPPTENRNWAMKMAIEIVDLPIKNGDFHSYVNVYQVVFHSYVSLPEGNQQLRFCTATIWADRYWESFAKKYPANENMALDLFMPRNLRVLKTFGAGGIAKKIKTNKSANFTI